MSTIFYNFSTGNDTTGNGSAGSPFKTFTKAIAASGSTDTISGGAVLSTEETDGSWANFVGQSLSGVHLAPAIVDGGSVIYWGALASDILLADFSVDIEGATDCQCGWFAGILCNVTYTNHVYIDKANAGSGSAGGPACIWQGTEANVFVDGLTANIPSGAFVWNEDTGQTVNISNFSVSAKLGTFQGSLGYTGAGMSGRTGTVLLSNGTLTADGDPTANGGVGVFDSAGTYSAIFTFTAVSITASFSGLARAVGLYFNNDCTVEFMGGGITCAAACVGLYDAQINTATTMSVVFSGGAYWNLGGTGTYSTAAAFHVEMDTLVATGTLRLNCNTISTVANGGVVNLSGLTIQCLGSDSIRGGKMSGNLVWNSTGSLDSKAAALDLSGSTIDIYQSVTITKQGSNAVTDTTGTTYRLHNGATMTASGWTSAGSKVVGNPMLLPSLNASLLIDLSSP